MIVKPITQSYKAWQFWKPTWDERPSWVAKCTEWRNGDLFHIRQSGDQLVNLGEWLVQDHDGITVFYTNEEFRKKFEVVNHERSGL